MSFLGETFIRSASDPCPRQHVILEKKVWSSRKSCWTGAKNMAKKKDSEEESSEEEESEEITEEETKKLKKDIVVELAAKVISSYTPMQVSLRQIHYRIVEMSKALSGFKYSNSRNEYNGLSRKLTKAREAGLIEWGAFVDRTRTFYPPTMPDYSPYTAGLTEDETNPVKIIQNSIWWLRRRADKFSLDKKLYQEGVVVIELEKAALQDVFMEAVDNRAFLIPTRGQGSTTQLKSFTDALESLGRSNKGGRPNLQFHLKTFGDFDPWGDRIVDSFIEKTQRYGANYVSIDRIALNEKMCIDLNLPKLLPENDKTLHEKIYGKKPYDKDNPDPRKKFEQEWIAKYKGVVELDAIEPHMLQQMINESIDKHYDKNIYAEVQRLERVLHKQYKKHVANIIVDMEAKLNIMKGGAANSP